MSTANGRPLPPPAPSQSGTQAEGTEGRSTGVRARAESAPEIDATAGTPGATSGHPGVAAPSPVVGAVPIISEIATGSVPLGSVPLGSVPLGPVPLAEGIRNNSIAPESLRKPYASLAPQPKKTPTFPNSGRSATGPRPPLESFPGIEDELTGTGPASPGQTNPGTKSSRSVCKKHKIARGKNGECLLCRKEEASSSSGLGWKLMVAFIVLAVVMSAVIAAYVKLKHF